MKITFGQRTKRPYNVSIVVKGLIIGSHAMVIDGIIQEDGGSNETQSSNSGYSGLGISVAGGMGSIAYGGFAAADGEDCGGAVFAGPDGEHDDGDVADGQKVHRVGGIRSG